MTNLCKDSISLLGFPPSSRTWNEDFNKYWSKDEYICIGNISLSFLGVISSKLLPWVWTIHFSISEIPEASEDTTSTKCTHCKRSISLKLRIPKIHLLIASQNCISSHKQKHRTLIEIWKKKWIVRRHNFLQLFKCNVKHHILIDVMIFKSLDIIALIQGNWKYFRIFQANTWNLLQNVIFNVIVSINEIIKVCYSKN